MAKKKQSQAKDVPDAANDAARDFFQEVIKHHGRGVIYIDTSAILDAFSEKDDLLRFLNDWDGGLITSNFVVVETVRRVTKARGPVGFKGPAGERGRDLACHFLSDWLTERKVIVLTIPEAVFDVARVQFPGIKGVAECDLADLISFLVVKGMEQDRIVSPDEHFARLGLQRFP